MLIAIELTGILVLLIGVFKHATKKTIGYQLVNVPGYIIACLGVLIIILGIVRG